MIACDVAVVGAGILGLATARELRRRHPGLSLTVLEKESAPARHQTGHNSGVIHSGLYYAPGSRKAALCAAGAAALHTYCAERGVPVARRGKLVLAVDETELPALGELQRRGAANGVADLVRLGPEALREVEPHARGVAALHVPGTAVVDFPVVAAALADDLRADGVTLRFDAGVDDVRPDGNGLVLATRIGEVRARHLVNCAGLQADRVARAAGARLDVAIVPFRGEYRRLRPERTGSGGHPRVRGLIYPVPDSRFPFLGVHLTRGLDGSVHAGPNAVLALAREGYARGDVVLRDALGTLAWPGFWKLVLASWRTGGLEWWRSRSAAAFAQEAARLVPELGPDDFTDFGDQGGGSGVRAQAVHRDGTLAHDFVFAESPRAVHVLSAPSPAATACLTLAAEIAHRAEQHFGLPRHGPDPHRAVLRPRLVDLSTPRGEDAPS